ncbi:M20/M25/M40 family metallo-hydrolase [uncultured Aquimarina sp.]|uniref:M20/M25/M40 family metallo-hydrolase n=1 Tax=uncultured Aquimarina sp. TaxID=575652 RepID=UPI0026061299|nr:M20/M25/M40 family metallo-hydrolase [uncultured Aquimarina sp.]
MKKLFSLLIIYSLSIPLTFAQQETSSFYATMALIDAEELQKEYPNEIEIIAKRRNEAAVFMSEEVSHKLHGRVLVHGPGFIYKSSETEAKQSLQKDDIKAVSNKMAFTITEDTMVNQAMNAIDTQNIENHITELENYGTRYHTSNSANQSAQDLKTKWETMASTYNRTDVSVRLVSHNSTPMKSVVMTIQGSEFPDEFVIVGGHLDSTSSQGNNDAPGADDDASGIATITEAARTLFEIGFQPKRTIEVMAYAAEEVGLRGSAEIAADYKTNNVNVIAVGQFDMTNYNGSANDVYFIDDNTDSTLNDFFKQLMDHYNTSGNHQLTYSTAVCNYGCSDHASWNSQGYPASFPFEANFSQYNPNIHTRNDTFSISGTAEHATKFAKLCSEFLIEIAKNDATLSTPEFEEEGYYFYVKNKILTYNISQTSMEVENINMYDINGRKVLQKKNIISSGNISLNSLSSGIYVITLSLKDQRQLSKKIILD